MNSRITHSYIPAALLALGSFATSATAQSVNVDFSNNGVGLPSSFGAAGSPGTWNAVAPAFNGPALPLVDTAGNPTSVTVELLSGTAISTESDPALTGDPATLLLDGYWAPDFVQSMRVQGLAAGNYNVTVYAWVPFFSNGLTTFLAPDGIGTIGGAYAGGLTEGVTHRTVTATVSGNGILTFEWVNGFFQTDGFFSGFQIESANLGTNYCPVMPNSTGSPAQISAGGSLSIAAGNLELSAGPVPNEPFIFYTGPNQILTPFGDGFRCVGGSVVRIWPPAFAAGNVAAKTIDPAAFGLTPGTWNFQCWFRDPAGMGAGFNLSDGLELVLVP